MNNDVNQNNTNLFPDSKTLEQPVSHEVLFETDNTEVNVSSNKKGLTNKTLILVIILIIVLSISASGGAVYFLSQNNQNKNSANNFNGSNTLPSNPIENEEQDNKEDNNQNNIDSEEKEEEIKPPVTPVTLTNEELEAYLEYIPFGIYDHSTLPYYNKISTLESVNKTVLVNMALSDTHEFKICEDPDNCLPEEVTSKYFEAYVSCYMDDHCDPKGYDFYPLDKVNANLEKMYNVIFNFLGIKEYDTWPSGGWEIMYYNNGFLSRDASGWYDHVIHAIDRYEANDKELIIYDCAVDGSYGMGASAHDFQTEEVIPIEDGFSNEEEFNQRVRNYVLEHKNEYTLFKHTYRKNNTGYYWYSTEVVS